jgi:hypothetical protein
MGRPKQGYYNAAGAKIPGTTTIIGRFKDSGALTQWAYKQGREHERLVAQGLEAPTRLYEVVQRAADAGTIAHDMIEADILKRPFVGPKDVDADILAKAGNAYMQFLEWRVQTHIEIVATEEAYVSEKYQFGGTVDAVGRDTKGRIVLIDWKTSNAIYQDYLIQLAAYALLLEECAPHYKPEGFHLLRVAKESADFAHYYFGELEQGKRAFVLMRELYGIDAELKQRAR